MNKFICLFLLLFQYQSYGMQKNEVLLNRVLPLFQLSEQSLKLAGTKYVFANLIDNFERILPHAILSKYKTQLTELSKDLHDPYYTHITNQLNQITVLDLKSESEKVKKITKDVEESLVKQQKSTETFTNDAILFIATLIEAAPESHDKQECYKIIQQWNKDPQGCKGTQELYSAMHKAWDTSKL